MDFLKEEEKKILVSDSIPFFEKQEKLISYLLKKKITLIDIFIYNYGYIISFIWISHIFILGFLIYLYVNKDKFKSKIFDFKYRQYSYTDLIIELGVILNIFSFVLTALLLKYMPHNEFGQMHSDGVFSMMFRTLAIHNDAPSITLVFLTFFFTIICILALKKYDQKNIEANVIALIVLSFFTINAFLLSNILLFFIFFEASLIPIYIIILGWGTRGRKTRAGYLIALYTIFGSIFLLLGIMYLYNLTGSFDYVILKDKTLDPEQEKWLWILFFLGFATKIPMFPLHIWLPEAHVEAPTWGSIMLAAILLKLGIYGVLRFNLILFPEGTLVWAPLVLTCALLGIFYTSLTAIRQIDLKKIVAYSSVGHMNAVVIGLMSTYVEGIEGGIFQMFAHGIVSGALFYCIGVLYERHGTRYLPYYGGVSVVMPLFSIFFFIFILANIGFPGTGNFVGEFTLTAGIFQESIFVGILVTFSMIFTAVYNLWAYNRVCFGNLKNISINKFADINKRELHILGLLTFILLVMGIYPKCILNYFHEFSMYIEVHSHLNLLNKN